MTNSKYVIAKKGGDYFFSRNLKQYELDCSCTNEACHMTIIRKSLLESFELTRDDFASPIRVNSAFRCIIFNESINGASTSNHTLGDALDLSVFSRKKEDLDRLEISARKFFKFVIRYKDFIHCDNRLNKEYY